MPLIQQTTLLENTWLGVWDISESLDELLAQLTLTKSEEELYAQLKGENRKKQWLAYRLIIKKILNVREILDINYCSHGRPVILNHPAQVSVSHSGKYAAAIVSLEKNVGCDIEMIHPRVTGVMHKFLNTNEIQDLGLNFPIEKITLLWAVKEAVYKLVGVQKSDFRNDILSEPFQYSPPGIVSCRAANKNFKVFYTRFDNYILTWVMN